MALFGSDKKSASASKKIRPTVLRTQNVAKELLNISKSKHVSVGSLDFNILEVETYTRVTKEGAEVDWEEISKDDMHELDDATAILNSRFEIKQVYEIEVFSKDDSLDLFKNFHAVIGANASKCKVYLSIKPGSKIGSSDKFEELFLDYINKSKIRAGILVDIFDEMVPDYVSKVSAQMTVDGEIAYDRNDTVLVSNAYEPTLTINDALVMHYEEKHEVGENEKIDYSQRGFIHSVLKDDLLIEYIKAKKGKAGRNCRGEFLEPKEPEESNTPSFSVDETIEETDNKDNIEYRAKESGYIALEGTMYQIKSDMDVGSIDFRSTGSVTAGIDSDVVLKINESDPEKDAIGKGMSVEVKEVDVVGNVGPKAKIRARKAKIDGQTHQESTIHADDLNIHVHKGTAHGDKVSITRLEAGKVRAKEVDIEQASGGDIVAKEIEIGLCVSHVKATASKLIEIHKLQGSENVFTIDPLIHKDRQHGLEENQDEIHELKEDVKEIRKEITKYTKIVKTNTASYNDVKKRLVHYKKSGIKMPSSFVNKFKQFQKMVGHLEAIKNELEVKDDKLQLLTTQTASFQDNIFDARIINRDRWVGHNEIIFKLVDPPIELTFSPPEGSPELIFAVVENEDSEFEIKAVSE